MGFVAVFHVLNKWSTAHKRFETQLAHSVNIGYTRVCQTIEKRLLRLKWRDKAVLKSHLSPPHTHKNKKIPGLAPAWAFYISCDALECTWVVALRSSLSRGKDSVSMKIYWNVYYDCLCRLLGGVGVFRIFPSHSFACFICQNTYYIILCAIERCRIIIHRYIHFKKLNSFSLRPVVSTNTKYDFGVQMNIC